MPTPRREWILGAVLVTLAWAVLPSAREAPRAQVHRCATAVLVDGRLVCDDDVPTPWIDPCGGSRALHGGDAIDTQSCEPGRMAPQDLAALDQPIDLNTASVEELEGLPGVGPKLAARIVEARPFTSVDALFEVRGVGPATFDRLRPRVIVRGPPRGAEPPSTAAGRAIGPTP